MRSFDSRFKFSLKSAKRLKSDTLISARIKNLKLKSSIPGSYRDWELHAMREMRKRYPNEHLFKAFNGPIKIAYFICTADGAQSILKNQEFDKKDFAYQFLIPWLGEGILISEGQKWHNRRKMLTAAFHYSILESFRGQMVELTQKGFDFDNLLIFSLWCHNESIKA